MALKTYKKAPVKINKTVYKKPEIKIEPEELPTRLTLWDVLVGFKYDVLTLMRTSTIARILIPSILIVTGSIILSRQLFPEIQQRAREATGYYNAARPELVKGESIQPKTTYLSDPGSDYFKHLTEDALDQDILQKDPVSQNFRGNFSLSIPSLELNDLPVEANVESGVEEAYDKALEDSLGHFKGTSLPISDIDNNTVIYGHSAGGDYYDRTKDVAAAFSKLNEIKIGDEVNIKIDGKDFKYRVVKTKIVKPDDTSIITGRKGRETLTLFTCYPNGNNAKRFVAVATPI